MNRVRRLAPTKKAGRRELAEVREASVRLLISRRGCRIVAKENLTEELVVSPQVVLVLEDGVKLQAIPTLDALVR